MRSVKRTHSDMPMSPRAASIAANSESLSLVQTLLRLPSGSGRLGMIRVYRNKCESYTGMSREDVASLVPGRYAGLMDCADRIDIDWEW